MLKMLIGICATHALPKVKTLLLYDIKIQSNRNVDSLVVHLFLLKAFLHKLEIPINVVCLSGRMQAWGKELGKDVGQTQNTPKVPFLNTFHIYLEPYCTIL